MKKFIVLALVLAPLNVWAADTTSGDMQQACQENSMPCEMFISALSSGMMGGLMTSELYFERSDDADTDQYIDVVHQKLFGCIPGDATSRQLYDVWMKFLDANPERLGEDPEFTLWDATTAAFPCN